ncbi:MAG: sel1 repeat family protein [Desulfobacteraceae bacterium]|nr:MAG: sel1 repeat family protein [Desulfobacteraceae bacterium]
MKSGVHRKLLNYFLGEDKTMKKFTLSLAFLLLCLSYLPLWAGDYRAAYEKNDFKTAFALAKPLADKGDPEAQHMLSGLYKVGWGVIKDYQLARKWMTKAASQGHKEAQSSLG